MALVYTISKEIFQGKERKDNTIERYLRKYFSSEKDASLFINLKTQCSEILKVLYQFEKECAGITSEEGLKSFIRILVKHYKVSNGLFHVQSGPEILTLEEAKSLALTSMSNITTTCTGEPYSLLELVGITFGLFDQSYNELNFEQIIVQAENHLDVRLIRSFIFFASFVKMYENS